MNGIGLIAALSAFLGIWLGHVSVRWVEFRSRPILPPSLAALAIGILLEYAALHSESPAVSTGLGIFGMTVLWSAVEFHRQHKRVEKGHAPANPNNPRHAALLAKSQKATTIDWLDREPLGRPYSADELQAGSGGLK